MRAHYFQHVPFEGLGCIEHWLRSAGAEVTSTRFFEPDSLPGMEKIDLLIVMGGPMSVNEEHRYGWLVSEKQYFRQAISRGKAVLGVCLGAQLIASALGARVYPNDKKEIGWFPITSVSDYPGARRFSFPPQALVFHWHGETFDLPAGALRLASSPACRNQAFLLGHRVIRLQFHLETTPDSARELVANCRTEFIPAEFVQSEREILSVPPSHYEAINLLMGKVLSFLLKAEG
jgi:GMP synthase-like glutamine amidotransferase